VRHPLGKPIPWQDGACKKRGELGRSPSHGSIILALPDIGAAFGRPSVFLGFSYPLRLAATRTALIRLSHQPVSGRAPTSRGRRPDRSAPLPDHASIGEQVALEAQGVEPGYVLAGVAAMDCQHGATPLRSAASIAARIVRNGPTSNARSSGLSAGRNHHPPGLYPGPRTAPNGPEYHCGSRASRSQRVPCAALSILGL
jgi:hypothetical protein